MSVFCIIKLSDIIMSALITKKSNCLSVFFRQKDSTVFDVYLWVNLK